MVRNVFFCLGGRILEVSVDFFDHVFTILIRDFMDWLSNNANLIFFIVI